ncbi:sensor histidine kinase, partial [Lysobacter sp. D1-1-M9]|uniref:sensor histidine kinase n=1 Tax=Novilysobacter longmucuonensis TaxID=3098603 RepID=UPI002FC7A76C
LHALAAPLPNLDLQLHIGPDVQVTDAGTAETVLRVVQEALTNSARHGSADRLEVDLQRRHGHLHLSVRDNGRLRGPLREGNGLGGMRERIEAMGGRLSLSGSAGLPLHIEAELPA